MRISKLIIVWCCFFITTIAMGQRQPIKGEVYNQDGISLEGVTIVELREGIKSFSVKFGEFTLSNSRLGDTILFRVMGYLDKHFIIKEDTFIRIVMENDPHIIETIEINTGYQQLPKERVTGSFTTVDNETFNQQISTDVLGRLEAVANGLVVDRGTTSIPRITVRGLSTIRGPKDALIIVDNFPYEGTIENINPNEVESITILKDAAAASIWGARAGNGVIVITTKKSKAEKEWAIELNSNITVGSKPDLSYIRQMAASDFIDVEQYLFGEGYYDSWINSINKRGLSPVVEILKSNSSDAEQQIDDLRNFDVRKDFDKYLYQRSINQQYGFGFSGGSENVSWRASVGYDNNLSNLDDKYNRSTVRIYNTYRPLKNLLLFSEVNYVKSNQKSGRPGYGDIIQGGGILPYAQLADENGAILPIVQGHSLSYLENIGEREILDWKFYPLEDYKYARSVGVTQDYLINTGVNYKFLSNFNFDFKYQNKRETISSRQLYDQNSYYTRDLINSFTQVKASGEIVHNIPMGGILDLSNSLLTSNSFRAQLNFDKNWSKHDIIALLGNELRTKRVTGESNRVYGYHDEILSYGLVDFKNSYPHFISGSQIYIPDKLGMRDVRTNFISTFLNASYTYDQKYIFSVSGRRDASNLFGLKTNDQWNPFWSAGVSWIASNEQFLENSILSLAKLRATYGFSGNIDPSMSAVTTIRYVMNSPYTLSPYSLFENYFNPNLRWETSKMLNIGLDFKTKNGVLSGTVEYYRKIGDNLFGESLVDYTLGVGNSIIENVASMKGNGIDIELMSNNLKGRLKWQTVFNFSRFRDHVTKYHLSSTQASFFVTSNVPISGIVGKPVYSIYGYRWAGLDSQTGDPQGYIDGEISKDYTVLTGSETDITELKYFGSAIPTTYGSFRNTFSFKNFTLDFSLLYKLGYYYRKSSINYGSLFNNWSGHADYSKRWQKPGDEFLTDVPSLVYPSVSARDAFYRGSEVLIEKGDHVRVQYVNLGYKFGSLLGAKNPFKTLHVYFAASDLGIIWRANKSKIDPDYNYTSNALRNTATYSVGIRADLRN